jgi:hypothetical protein
LDAVDDAARVIKKYNRFAERVDELGLQGDVDAKPILDVSPATAIPIAAESQCVFDLTLF